MIWAISVLCVLLLGCAMPQNLKKNAISSTPNTSNNTTIASIDADQSTLSDALFETYYLPSEHPVYAYLQNKSIQRFFHMWCKESIDEDVEVHWNYDTIAPVQLLDHEFHSIARPGEELYTCTFSTDNDRHGYIIVLYGEGNEGPYITKWSLCETTPYLYDLRANSEQIIAALKETDIDLSTASASRAEWIDTDKKRGDRIILFTDSKEDHYICYFGEEKFTIEKQ